MRRLVYFIPKKTPYSQIVHVESHILSAIKWPTFIWLQVAKVPEQLSAINCDKNFYYSTTAKTVQKKYKYTSIFCTVENLFAVPVGMRMQNCHTLPLSLINLLTTAVG